MNVFRMKWTIDSRTVRSLRYVNTHSVQIHGVQIHVHTGLTYKAKCVLAVTTLPVELVYVPLQCMWLG